jgi:hypothetical protein
VGASDEEDESDEDDEEHQNEEEALPDDEQELVEELDEAGSGMNDYKRGKRLKKLVKVLMGPMAQTHNARLKWVSFVVVAVLVVVDLAMFLVFSQMTTKQKAQVFDLRSSSKAVNRVMMTAISVSSLEILLEGKNVSHIRYLGQGGVQQDFNFLLNEMEERVADLEEYHKGVFRGFTSLRQLPAAYGLRSTW